MILAARCAYPEAVRVLLDHGASPFASISQCEAEDDGYVDGWSQPLHACVFPDQEASETDITTVVRYLLDAGASPLIRNNLGYTPLMLALQKNHSEAAMILLEKSLSLGCSYDGLRIGVEPDDEAFKDGERSEELGPDEKIYPILHFAAQSREDAIVDRLLSIPDFCDVNEEAEDGSSPLSCACGGVSWVDFSQESAKEIKLIVAKLLDHGANPTKKAILDLDQDYDDPEISVFREFAIRGGTAAQVLVSSEKDLLNKHKRDKRTLAAIKSAVDLIQENTLVKPAKRSSS